MFNTFFLNKFLILGFNLNLRSLVVYDIAGLEWSDDSLFFYILLSQSIGAFIGIPIAGKYH